MMHLVVNQRLGNMYAYSKYAASGLYWWARPRSAPDRGSSCHSRQLREVAASATSPPDVRLLSVSDEFPADQVLWALSNQLLVAGHPHLQQLLVRFCCSRLVMLMRSTSPSALLGPTSSCAALRV